MIKLQVTVQFKKLPKNIYFSKNNFNKDFILSKVVLYRGSTAIINAVRLGLFPIYLNIHENFNIDPLFDIEDGKFKISKTKDFIKAYIGSKPSNKILKYC